MHPPSLDNKTSLLLAPAPLVVVASSEVEQRLQEAQEASEALGAITIISLLVVCSAQVRTSQHLEPPQQVLVSSAAPTLDSGHPPVTHQEVGLVQPHLAKAMQHAKVPAAPPSRRSLRKKAHRI